MQRSLHVRTIVYITLRSLGIYKTAAYRFPYAIAVLSLISVLLLGTVIGFLTCRNTADKFEVITIMVPQIASGTVFLNFFLAKGNLLKLLNKLTHHAEHADYIIIEADKLVKKKLIRTTAVMILLAILSVTPSILYAFHSIDISDKYSFVVPFWFSCGDAKLHTILQFLCWKVNTKSQIVVANMIQGVMAGAMFMIAFSATTLFSIVIFELSILVRIFRAKIQHLVELMEQQKTIPSCKKYQNSEKRIIDDYLIDIIKYQQYVKSCTIDTVTTWNSYLSIHVINYAIILAALLFMIVMEQGKDLLLTFRTVCFNMYLLIAFALTCEYGHFISNLNEIVFTEMCKIPWYHQSAKFRKIYTNILTLNRKTIRLKIVQMYELNLNLIIALFRTSFSILNVLLLKNQNHRE